MTTNELPALKIYWDGTILSTPGGVDYVSGKSELVELTSVVNFAQLQVVIRRVIGLNDADEIVKIYLRVPRFDEHGRFQKYDGFPMETDVHMEAMWRNISRTPQMRVLEFYIVYNPLSQVRVDVDDCADVDDCTDVDDCVDVDDGDDFSDEDEEEEHFYGAVADDNEDDDDDDIGGENGDGTHGENVGAGKEFELGMVFSSRHAVQTCATSYHIAANKEYKSSQTIGKTIVLVCVNNDTCNWRLRASLLKGETDWMITRYNGPHQCSGQSINQDHRNLRARQIAEHIDTQLHLQRDIRIKTLQEGIFQKLRVRPGYKKTWYAKEKAIANKFGQWDDSFKEICNFMTNVTVANPRTVWHATGTPIENNPQFRTFKHMFWTYEPVVKGFQYCKPVVYIDDTHTYGKYEMTLLIASAIEGNNHIMPIAFAIVKSETAASWRYFMRMLKRYVLGERKVCIISDRGSGIMSAMEGPEWAGDTHKWCIRHLVSNFHNAFKKKYLKELAEKAGNFLVI
ncbi:uncharacterized protein LOC126657091 [Mercurialis annua]|uniref:uncharacterized protein LOC126657091 n=1 Tax=Mercurialis annua TaxID=3986 RepID=UPI0024ADE83A|nr:uncharacterized protein LOC126657091 [Mercurialis annua]